MLRSQFKSKIPVIYVLVAPVTVVETLCILVMLQFMDVMVFLLENGFILYGSYMFVARFDLLILGVMIKDVRCQSPVLKQIMFVAKAYL